MKGDRNCRADLVSDKTVPEFLVIHCSDGLPQPGLYMPLCVYANAESSLASRLNIANGCEQRQQKLNVIKYLGLFIPHWRFLYSLVNKHEVV